MHCPRPPLMYMSIPVFSKPTDVSQLALPCTKTPSLSHDAVDSVYDCGKTTTSVSFRSAVDTVGQAGVSVVSTVRPLDSVWQLTTVPVSVGSQSGRIWFRSAACGSQSPTTSMCTVLAVDASHTSLPCTVLLTVLLALDVPLDVSDLVALLVPVELPLLVTVVVIAGVVAELLAVVVSVVKSQARYVPA